MNKQLVCIIFLLIQYLIFGQERYTRLLDSAEAYTNTDSKTAKIFLDSIPKPFENFIKDDLARYYYVKSIIHNFNYETAEYQQCTVLALKYAKIEDKPCIAGQSCVNLFSEFFYVNKDSIAYEYLNEAERYFDDCKESYYNLAEVETMRAYAKMVRAEYNESINLLEPRLDYYKGIEQDQYFYLFACYMLSVNYSNLDNIQLAHYYHKLFLKLKGLPAVLDYNYSSFDVDANFNVAEAHFRKNNIDSTFVYLNKCRDYTRFMGGRILRKYYKLYSRLYEKTANLEMSKAYIDSLVKFEDKISKTNLGANINISNALLNAENELFNETKKKSTYTNFIYGLFITLIVASTIYLIYYRIQRKKIILFKEKTSHLEYVKSNNKELSVKLKSLEEYIKTLRKEVKEISQIQSLDEQKQKIKTFYNDLHINSSTILDKSENHLELINDLNIDFFRRLKEVYPNLNKSEIIICYYILLGFTNKEIAAFLNVSIRSVESKRYRVSKKIEFDKENKTFVEHLKQTFGDTLPVYQLN
ncbi:MAG: helix-turn-helix transcriptional regulator [Jejuia sp.]